VATNTDILLVLVKKKDVEVPQNDTPYDFQIEEEFLSTDPVIHYDHKEITTQLKEKHSGVSLAPLSTPYAAKPVEIASGTLESVVFSSTS
jgi:hypothetical protein